MRSRNASSSPISVRCSSTPLTCRASSHTLPVLAEVVTVVEGPALGILVTVEINCTAQRVGRQIVVASSDPVWAESAADQCEIRLEGEADQSEAVAARSDGGVTVHPLRHECPIRSPLEAQSGTVEAGQPGVLESIAGCGIATIVVVKHPELESLRPGGLRAEVVAGPIVDFMEELDLVPGRAVGEDL